MYSCKAKQVYWDGKSYVKDDATDAFEFTLYSPQDRDETPGHAVGDTVFAVIRGNHWEVLGGGGGGGNPLRTGTLLTPLVASSGDAWAYLSTSATSDTRIYSRTLMGGRSVEAGTSVTYLTDTQGLFRLVDFTHYSQHLMLPMPTLSTSGAGRGINIIQPIANQDGTTPMSILSSKFFPRQNAFIVEQSSITAYSTNITPAFPCSMAFRFRATDFVDGPVTANVFCVGDVTDQNLVVADSPSATPILTVNISMAGWMDTHLPLPIWSLIRNRYRIGAAWGGATNPGFVTGAFSAVHVIDRNITVPANTTANRNLWTCIRYTDPITGVESTFGYYNHGQYSRP